MYQKLKHQALNKLSFGCFPLMERKENRPCGPERPKLTLPVTTVMFRRPFLMWSVLMHLVTAGRGGRDAGEIRPIESRKGNTQPETRHGQKSARPEAEGVRQTSPVSGSSFGG